MLHNVLIKNTVVSCYKIYLFKQKVENVNALLKNLFAGHVLNHFSQKYILTNQHRDCVGFTEFELLITNADEGKTTVFGIILN